MSLARVYLKPGRSGPTFGRHPWIFSNAIAQIEGEVSNAGEVAVLSEKGQFLGYGLFNAASQIRIRMYSWKEAEPLTKDFWSTKIAQAIGYRHEILKLNRPLDCVRLIFSEGDELSGLTVDRFADTLVVQIGSLGIFTRREMIFEILRERLRPKAIWLRMEPKPSEQEGMPCLDELVWGSLEGDSVTIEENSVKFEVDIRSGQKTGFYADQRDHRRLLSQLAPQKRVLDLCTYVGAFSLECAKAGASEVIGVDSSAFAIHKAREAAIRNEISHVEFIESDVLHFLKSDMDPFDIVIMDPPRLAPSKADKRAALRTYYHWNKEALKKVKRGGIFATFSCSHQIKPEDLYSTLSSVVRRSGRSARIIHQGIQAADHPVSVTCPESLYLKSLVLLVD